MKQVIGSQSMLWWNWVFWRNQFWQPEMRYGKNSNVTNFVSVWLFSDSCWWYTPLKVVQYAVELSIKLFICLVKLVPINFDNTVLAFFPHTILCGSLLLLCFHLFIRKIKELFHCLGGTVVQQLGYCHTAYLFLVWMERQDMRAGTISAIITWDVHVSLNKKKQKLGEPIQTQRENSETIRFMDTCLHLHITTLTGFNCYSHTKKSFHRNLCRKTK